MPVDRTLPDPEFSDETIPFDYRTLSMSSRRFAFGCDDGLVVNFKYCEPGYLTQ